MGSIDPRSLSSDPGWWMAFAFRIMITWLMMNVFYVRLVHAQHERDVFGWG